MTVNKHVNQAPILKTHGSISLSHSLYEEPLVATVVWTVMPLALTALLIYWAL
jgi:hypothetical protein